MANTRELRRRIRSVKNTSQITRAMQMVAATKMRRAQMQAENSRPYTQTLNQSLAILSGKVDPALNPLLQESSFDKALDKDSKNMSGAPASAVGIIVLSTDKGLVGALNTNILRTLNSFVKEKQNIVFYTIGRKGRQFIVRTGKDLAADFENTDVITFRQAKQLARLIKDAFLKKDLKEVYILYPDFVSTLRQEPKLVKLLPISKETMEVEMGLTVATPSLRGGTTKQSQKDSGQSQNDGGLSEEFLFEPNTAFLLDYILNHSIETKIYQALLETKASEHSARMIAMKNATDNAKELVSDLTLTYNQTRQQAITNELLEITTAGAALE